MQSVLSRPDGPAERFAFDTERARERDGYYADVQEPARRQVKLPDNGLLGLYIVVHKVYSGAGWEPTCLELFADLACKQLVTDDISYSDLAPAVQVKLLVALDDYDRRCAEARRKLLDLPPSDFHLDADRDLVPALRASIDKVIADKKAGL